MKNIIMFATDKSTGEDRNIKAVIHATGDDEAEVAALMAREPYYEFSGWEYDE